MLYVSERKGKRLFTASCFHLVAEESLQPLKALCQEIAFILDSFSKHNRAMFRVEASGLLFVAGQFLKVERRKCQ